MGAVQGARDMEEAEGDGEARGAPAGATSRKALVVCPHDGTVWAISRTVRPAIPPIVTYPRYLSGIFVRTIFWCVR